MALSNAESPYFPGKVTAGGFDAIHANGVSVTAISTTNVTHVYPLGTTLKFNGVITGVYMVDLDGSSQTMTVYNGGVAVCTISQSGTAGTVKGATTLSNTTLSVGGTMSVATNGSAGGGEARVFLTYKVS